ncbi:MAG: hypothetical protein U0270_35300 [Labilithrix sp.]
MKTPRERALARIKTLAAAGVVVGCNSGYGVVDPLPSPACFESPGPIVTAKVLETKEDGTRLVELLVKFQQTDAKVGALEAYHVVELGGGSNKLDLTEQAVTANDLRAVIGVPKGVKQVVFTAQVKCANGHGFNAQFDIDDAGTVKLTYVR